MAVDADEAVARRDEVVVSEAPSLRHVHLSLRRGRRRQMERTRKGVRHTGLPGARDDLGTYSRESHLFVFGHEHGKQVRHIRMWNSGIQALRPPVCVESAFFSL